MIFYNSDNIKLCFFAVISSLIEIYTIKFSGFFCYHLLSLIGIFSKLRTLFFPYTRVIDEFYDDTIIGSHVMVFTEGQNVKQKMWVFHISFLFLFLRVVLLPDYYFKKILVILLPFSSQTKTKFSISVSEFEPSLYSDLPAV